MVVRLSKIDKKISDKGTGFMGQGALKEDIYEGGGGGLMYFFYFLRNASISLAALLPDAIAYTTRLAPFTASPAAKTLSKPVS